MHEFVIRVKKYGERERIKPGFHVTALNRLWGDDGVGVLIEIPGYAHTLLIMVRVEHFPWVEFYHQPQTFIQEEMIFDRDTNPDEAFLAISGQHVAVSLLLSK